MKRVTHEAIPDHLLTVRQVSKQLGVRRQTIRKLISLGQLPVWRYNDRVYVDPLSARAALDRVKLVWPFNAR